MTVRYHLTCIRMTIIRKKGEINAGEEVEEKNPLTLLMTL